MVVVYENNFKWLVENHRDLFAGLRYDEISAPGGTYFVSRCTPVYPADI